MLTISKFENYLSHAIFYHLLQMFLLICMYIFYTINNQFFHLRKNIVNIQYGSYNTIYIIVFKKENFSFKCIIKLKNKNDKNDKNIIKK